MFVFIIFEILVKLEFKFNWVVLVIGGVRGIIVEIIFILVLFKLKLVIVGCFDYVEIEEF